MPLYEYRCHGCGKVFELRQKFSDEPVTVHEECGGEVERLISVPAFQFKGTGWYVTDYARGSNGGSGSSGSSESSRSSESKSSEGKSAETKSSETKSSETKSSDSSATRAGGKSDK